MLPPINRQQQVGVGGGNSKYSSSKYKAHKNSKKHGLKIDNRSKHGYHKGHSKKSSKHRGYGYYGGYQYKNQGSNYHGGGYNAGGGRKTTNVQRRWISRDFNINNAV